MLHQQTYMNMSVIVPFQCALSILYTFIRDLESMLTYLVVTEQIRIFLTIVSLLVMRRTKPHIKRPYKVRVCVCIIERPTQIRITSKCVLWSDKLKRCPYFVLFINICRHIATISACSTGTYSCHT